MTRATLESDEAKDPRTAAHIEDTLSRDVVREDPFPDEGGRLVIARTEGHLGVDDDLQRHLGTWVMEGCTDQACAITEEDGLEVILLPLLIPVDVGQLLRRKRIGEARDGEAIEELAGRVSIILLRRDEGLQLVGILLKAIEAQRPQLGDEPVTKVFITERRGGTIVVVADSQL